jgi:coproporphyrinogen III oxidase
MPSHVSRSAYRPKHLTPAWLTLPFAGYGITCVLEDGKLLEKAAANISVVRGTLSPARAQAMSSRGRSTIDPAGGQPYSAAALSLVFHSAHPLVPTLRADVRLFQVCLCARHRLRCLGACCCHDTAPV